MKTLTRILITADRPTPNGNIYPLRVLHEAVAKAQEQVQARRFLGNLDGKFPVVLAEASHVVTKLWMEGLAMVATIEFLDTPQGLKAQQSLDAVGERLPSARLKLTPTGRGITTQTGVVEAYELESVTVEFEPEERELREENADLNRLFEMQRKRVEVATQRWREATGEHLTLPDLGTLVQWLLDGRDEVERENAELKAIIGWGAQGPRSPSALYEENLKLKAAIRHHMNQDHEERPEDRQLYAAAGFDCEDVALSPTVEEGLESAMELVSAQGALIELKAVAEVFEAVQAKTLKDNAAGGEKMIADIMVNGMKTLANVVRKRIEDLTLEVQTLERK